MHRNSPLLLLLLVMVTALRVYEPDVMAGEENLDKSMFSTTHRTIDFSLDQGVHNKYLSEWWYYTGHLAAETGETFGYELCFFRVSPVGFFVHTAITDEGSREFYFERKLYSIDKVSLTKKTADLIYGSAGSRQQGDFTYQLWSTIGCNSFKLDLTSEKPPLIVNGDGIIYMPEGMHSYYYSLPRLRTSGVLTINSTPVDVTGISWMDHQWGNFIACRVGWDWFSFQMEDNTEYNLFSFRDESDRTGKQHVNISEPDGKNVFFKKFEIKRMEWWESPATGKLYVTKWEITIPDREEEFVVEATIPNQEMYPTQKADLAPTYWEGSCRILKITRDGTMLLGVGYTEQFPYRSQMPQGMSEKL